MQPSTQVTHIPEFGVTEPSVRFLVKVAADELILESVMDIVFPPLPLSTFLDFTRNAWLHITHHIIKYFFFNTGWAYVGATATDRLLRIGESTSE
jgi:hypothetical protein